MQSWSISTQSYLLHLKTSYLDWNWIWKIMWSMFYVKVSKAILRGSLLSFVVSVIEICRLVGCSWRGRGRKTQRDVVHRHPMWRYEHGLGFCTYNHTWPNMILCDLMPLEVSGSWLSIFPLPHVVDPSCCDIFPPLNSCFKHVVKIGIG